MRLAVFSSCTQAPVSRHTVCPACVSQMHASRHLDGCQLLNCKHPKLRLSCIRMRARCPFLQRLTCLSGKLAKTCLEHKGRACHRSDTKLCFQSLNNHWSAHRVVAGMTTGQNFRTLPVEEGSVHMIAWSMKATHTSGNGMQERTSSIL